MKGVIKSIDGMILTLDEVLSTGRLKPSERRKLRNMQRELAAAREQIAKYRPPRDISWFLQAGSLVARVAELLDRHLQ